MSLAIAFIIFIRTILLAVVHWVVEERISKNSLLIFQNSEKAFTDFFFSIIEKINFFFFLFH